MGAPLKDALGANSPKKRWQHKIVILGKLIRQRSNRPWLRST
jgi:hypothetical protein